MATKCLDPFFCQNSGQDPAWKWLHGLSEAEAARLAAEIPDRIETGPFKPKLESRRSYTCSQWFRDAKFGIWVCYGPQSVPAKSGWYGRQMYDSLLSYWSTGNNATTGFIPVGR